jgi:crotonobetainyl-CoA:carnitine CoA-transferase CaiB-like acyl-CoA transferase
VPGVRTPIRFSDSTLVYDKPSPQLGADTEEIRAAIEAGKPAFRAKR